MECLITTFSFDVLMDNHFTSFRLFTHLRVYNIQATRMLNKNRLRKCTIIGDKQLQKNRKSTNLNRTTVGRFTWLSLNLVNLRDLFCVGTKLKESIWKNKNQINSTVTIRTWVLSTEWTRTWPSTGLVSEWKNGGVLRLFEW